VTGEEGSVAGEVEGPGGAVAVDVAVLELDQGLLGVWAVKRTSTSLVESGSVSTCRIGRGGESAG
jgi:hypothetical protein